MKKMLLAVNPYAGTRKAYKQLADIVAVLNRGDYDVSVYISDGPGDVAQMVANRACDVDVVACCGGDGDILWIPHFPPRDGTLAGNGECGLTVTVCEKKTV